MKNWKTELNNSQLKAAEQLDGPLLILAGAGSGKTKTMTHRICHMLEVGIPASSILAITFTNKAADEMKERVEKMINEGTGEDLPVPLVCTFHSLGYRMLKRFGHIIGYKGKISICDEDDRKKRMQDIIKDIMKKTETLNDEDDEETEQSVKNIYEEVSKLISRFKDELIVPSLTNTFVPKEGEVFPYLEIAKEVYPIYERQLFMDNCLDFDDLIEKAVFLMYEEEPRNFYNEQFAYISVDEYQDTSKSQARLVSLLAGERKNICVVGDDYQSIYAFRGAVVDNILNFEKEYHGCKIVTLEENYRSTQNIVEAASGVITNNSKQYKKNLFSMNEEGSLVQVREYDNDKQEAEAIVKKIEKAKDVGLKYSEMAILYRTNAMSRIYEDALIKKSIPYKIYGGVSFYDRREIKDIVAYLKLASGTDDTMALKRIANVPKRKLGEKSVGDMLSAIRDEENAPLLSRLSKYAKAKPKFLELSSLLDDFRRSAETESLSSLIMKILNTIDYEGYIHSFAKNEDDLSDRKENVYELVNKAASFSASYTRDTSLIDSEGGEGDSVGEVTPAEILDAFLEDVALMTDVSKDSDFESVSLMTMHKSKGLEYNTVYVAGCEESAMGILPEEFEESRRLFYVAMTRAKKKLYISYADSRYSFGKVRCCMPLPFVNEIPECNKKFKHISEKDSEKSTSFYSGNSLRSNKYKVEKPWWLD